MKALRVNKEGADARIAVEDVEIPMIRPGELLVKIRASFIQPADVLNSKGGFAITTFPRTLGKDFAGTVVDGSDEWKDKDVFGTSGSSFSFIEDGGQAEYAVLKESAATLKPSTMSFAQAGAIGTPATTALTTLRRARVQSSDVVMVLGATGSVGSFVLQIAKSLGCTTIGVGHHGTDINSSDDPKLEKAKSLTDGRGPDVVVDTVGDFALTKAALDVMAVRGRMSFITAPRSGSTELPVDILSLYRRQIELIGCNTAGAPQSEMASLLRDLTPGFESGVLMAPEENSMSRISIDQAIDAYSGKIKRAVMVFDS